MYCNDPVLTCLFCAFQDEVREYYATVAVPILSSSGIPSLVSSALSVTLEGFLHAYALVSSRAFLVDAFHGLSMVPIADA